MLFANFTNLYQNSSSVPAACSTARHLRAEAETVVAEAKARVERIILGQEAGE